MPVGLHGTYQNADTNRNKMPNEVLSSLLPRIPLLTYLTFFLPSTTLLLIKKTEKSPVKSCKRLILANIQWVRISYLVRIYRKADNNPLMLVGVVEEVGKDGKKAFHTLYELWDILNTKKEKQTKQRKTENNGMGRKNWNL